MSLSKNLYNMAVLFVTHKFPPSIGGMQKQSYELINGVRKHAKVYTIAIKPAEHKCWFIIRLKSRIKAMLHAHPDINIIHCNDGLMASFCSWLTDYKHLKVTATLHGLDLVFPNAVFQKYVVPKLRRFDQIYCVSQATANECLQRGFDPSKVKVIHNGVDMRLKDIAIDDAAKERFKQNYNIAFDQERIILGVGRAVKRKGFSWFIRNVLPTIDNATFVMVGPIQDVSSLSHRLMSILPKNLKRQIQLMLGYPSDSGDIATAMHATSKAIHLSHVPYEDLMQLYAHSSLFVMPNIKIEGDMEGFGLVALEAILRGCPVVGARLEGIQDAISHQQNGILLPSEDASIWSREINSLLNNQKHLELLSNKALVYTVNTFSWDKMATEYWHSFEELSYNQATVPMKEIALAS